MIFKKYYGWQENGKFYLSVFPPHVDSRARNEYASKQEAEDEAKTRGRPIEWQE